MGNGAKKGARRERHARELYERAGYNVYSPQNPKFGDNDLWNLYDLAAYQPPGIDLRFVQVKSNRASGINDWCSDAHHFTMLRDCSVDFLVCHDGEGWRVIQPTVMRDDLSTFETVVDERETDGNMGDDVVQWLRGGRHD